jgi:uncharacterized protein
MSATELKNRREAMLMNGEIVKIHVQGWKEPHYALAADAPLLDALMVGDVPKAWAPQDTTTHDEVTFLAPLDPVSARGRTKLLFDFDYVWEVYKPAHQRKWGYYTLPILWGDQLVARIDLRFERRTHTLVRVWVLVGGNHHRSGCKVCGSTDEGHRTVDAVPGSQAVRCTEA